jgi:hypothetical protein
MFISYSIKNKLNNKGKEMSYIFKKGDIVRVKKVVGDDPSLMRENQVVESVKKIDVTDIDTYQVDLVGSAYLFTNHDLELVNSSVTYPDSNEKSNILKVEDDIIDANLVEPELVYQESNKYIYLYNGDKYTIYSPNQVTAEKRIKEKIKKEYGI